MLSILCLGVKRAITFSLKSYEGSQIKLFFACSLQEGTGPRVLSAYVELIFDNTDNRIPVSA